MNENTAVNTSQAALLVTDLNKSYSLGLRSKLAVLKQVNLRLACGEVYGLLGPNGAGKSTLMKCILGLVRPDSGSCLIFDKPASKRSSRQALGYLPENAYFYKHLSALETLQMYAKINRQKNPQRDAQIHELLELCGLQDAAHRRIGGFSKGMLQRLGLAQALLGEVKLLVLDEPSAGVDPLGTSQICSILDKLKKRGCSILLCSHQLDQVEQLCDRIGIMQDGRLLVEGSLEDLTRCKDTHSWEVRGLLPHQIALVSDFVAGFDNAQIIKNKPANSSLEQAYLENIK